MCGFLAALDLSAVPLYGDDRSIASSASNFVCPRTFEICAEQKNKEQRMRISHSLFSFMQICLPNKLVPKRKELTKQALQRAKIVRGMRGCNDLFSILQSRGRFPKCKRWGLGQLHRSPTSSTFEWERWGPNQYPSCKRVPREIASKR